MESSSSSSSSSSSISSSRSSSSSSSSSSSFWWSVILTTIIPVLIILLLSPLLFSSKHSSTPPSPSLSIVPSPPLPPRRNSHSHSFIKNTCTNTLYPSLCIHTLSSIPSPLLDLHLEQENHTAIPRTARSLRRVLQFAIEKTIYRVTKSRSRILSFKVQQNNNWVDNCIELLDQTLYELQESIKPRFFTTSSSSSYTTIKSLLSAAMTNQYTCMEGFDDLNTQTPPRLARFFQKSLTPIMRMISNCLAIINYIETQTHTQTRLLSTTLYRDHVTSWMTATDRRLMQIPPKIIPPTVVVAIDGTGNFTTIAAAVSMAPNRSSGRYVIQIKAGIYNENLFISRQKSNIMLVGEGMNSTIITSNKNFVDGYTTFTSATQISSVSAVIGNNFLARDLTVINTSGPEKHQAVALRVTSDAAFYHCQFISHQDTLYAHSLNQLYRECAIHGTVDFIFGNAAAIFERCLILVRKPILGQRNVITAQGRLDPNQNTGISIQDCTIMAAPDFPVAERANFSTFLGRPWRNYSRTIVMRSYLGEIIDPQGWCAWNQYSNLNTVEYIEYLNFGPGANTKNRVQWAGYHNNSSRDVEKFTIQSFLHGADEWLKTTDLPSCSGLYAKDCKKDSAQVS